MIYSVIPPEQASLSVCFTLLDLAGFVAANSQERHDFHKSLFIKWLHSEHRIKTTPLDNLGSMFATPNYLKQVWQAGLEKGMTDR